MSGASRIFSGELGTVRVFAALGAAGFPELYSTFMLLVWPSLVEEVEGMEVVMVRRCPRTWRRAPWP